MMYRPEEFYHGFQVNHFDYKQLNNRLLLNLSDEEIQKIIKLVVNGSKEEYLRSVKGDIRLTFLLSIETLFELIFSLLPNEKNQINDTTLIYRLVEKKPYYEEIRKFNKGEKSKLDWLKKDFNFNNGQKAPFLRHVFYFGLWKDEINESVEKSLPVIEDALKILAHELSNREELNSYKHGLRSIPFMKSLILAEPETLKEKIKFDMDDSVTIYSHNKKTGVREFLTKQFDPERDMALTHVASNLINNIIQPRKTLYKKGKSEDTLPIIFFFDEDLKNASKTHVQMQDFRYTITPVDEK